MDHYTLSAQNELNVYEGLLKILNSWVLATSNWGCEAGYGYCYALESVNEGDIGLYDLEELWKYKPEDHEMMSYSDEGWGNAFWCYTDEFGTLVRMEVLKLCIEACKLKLKSGS